MFSSPARDWLPGSFRGPVPGGLMRLRVPSRLSRSRWATAILLAVVLAAGGYLFVAAAISFGAWLFVQVIEMAARGVVWTVVAIQGGLDFWDVLAALGVQAGELLAAPQVTLAAVGIELVGAAALYALHRLLVSDKESSQ